MWHRSIASRIQYKEYISTDLQIVNLDVIFSLAIGFNERLRQSYLGRAPWEVQVADHVELGYVGIHLPQEPCDELQATEELLLSLTEARCGALDLANVNCHSPVQPLRVCLCDQECND